MKNTYWAIAIIAVVGLATAFYFREDMMRTSIDAPLSVIPISHASLILNWGDDAIYIDPVGGTSAYEGERDPNIILVTDIHGDHLSTSTINSFTGNYGLVVPQAVAELLSGPSASVAQVVNNGQTVGVEEYLITAIPMYNMPESSASPHTKGRGNGYLIERDGFRVYIAGDTSATPEMKSMGDIDIAFVPMNLPYTMSVEEAADAVLAFRPKIVYPYHYRTPNGLSDVERFKEIVNTGDPNIQVVLEEWYPQ